MEIIRELVVSPLLLEIFLSFEQVFTMRKKYKEWSGKEDAHWAAQFAETVVEFSELIHHNSVILRSISKFHMTYLRTTISKLKVFVINAD